WSVGVGGGRGPSDMRFVTTPGTPGGGGFGPPETQMLLVSTPTITSSEQSLAFMEFAVVGIDPAILSGEAPPLPFGQPTTVLERFPAAADAGGRGFVEGLAEFCFPGGAEIHLAPEDKAETMYGPHEDRLHVLQFTDASHTTSYGCCIVITERLRRPSAALLVALWRRELERSAARTIQRFAKRWCCGGGLGDCGAGGGGATSIGGSNGNMDSNRPLSGRRLAAVMEAILRISPAAQDAHAASGASGKVKYGLGHLASIVAAAAAAAERAGGGGGAAVGGDGDGAADIGSPGG
ncbi:unnamed protein product, partial [Phaeothamnion confervicola]